VLLTDTKVASLKPPATGGIEHRDLKVRGLRLRVGSSGKKTWLLRARVKDKVIAKTLGHYPSMGVAAARTSAEKVLGAVSRDGSTASLDRTFKDVADAWVERIAKTNKSWKFQQRCLELHVLDKWGTRKIVDIRRGDVRELLDGLDGSIPNRILATVRPIFRFALSRDYIEASPVEGIIKPTTDVSRDRVLSMDEIARIWKGTGRLGYPLAEYLRVLMLVAQRRSEVAAMRWDSIDLDAATWVLGAADTKNAKAHLVPLSPPIVEILRSLPKFGPYVFTSNGRSHISGYSKTKARLDALIEADGGGPMKPWRLHDLRRTASTELVGLGVSVEVVGRVLNHTPQGVTARVYALHQYNSEKRDALNRWAAEVMRTLASQGEGQ
jgi:integrase